MSHLAAVDVEIHDFDCLAKTCDALGLEFVPNQNVYHWWGHSVGDYPIPEGFTVKELGHCEHAIRVKGTHSGMKNRPYEIGVVRRRDKDGNRLPGYTLIWDWFGGGKGMVKYVGGNDCQKLIQEYTLQVSEKQMQPLKDQGWVIERKVEKDGRVRLEATEGNSGGGW